MTEARRRANHPRQGSSARGGRPRPRRPLQRRRVGALDVVASGQQASARPHRRPQQLRRAGEGGAFSIAVRTTPGGRDKMPAVPRRLLRAQALIASNRVRARRGAADDEGDQVGRRPEQPEVEGELCRLRRRRCERHHRPRQARCRRCADTRCRWARSERGGLHRPCGIDGAARRAASTALQARITASNGSPSTASLRRRGRVPAPDGRAGSVAPCASSQSAAGAGKQLRRADARQQQVGATGPRTRRRAARAGTPCALACDAGVLSAAMHSGSISSRAQRVGSAAVSSATVEPASQRNRAPPGPAGAQQRERVAPDQPAGRSRRERTAASARPAAAAGRGRGRTTRRAACEEARSRRPPGHQAQGLAAGADQDVLAVVEAPSCGRRRARPAAAGAAPSRTASRGAPRLRRLDRGGEPGPAGADHGDAQRAASRQRPRHCVRAAIHSLRSGVSEVRWSST